MDLSRFALFVTIAATSASAALASACDIHEFAVVGAPSLALVTPNPTLAGNNVTALGDNLDLTPWEVGDRPPSSSVPVPVAPLPYDFAAAVGGITADVSSVSTGGCNLRIPDELEPGVYDVRVWVAGVASNAVEVEVQPAPRMAIAIVPNPLRLAVGSTRPFQVFAIDGDFSIVDVTADVSVELAADPDSLRVDVVLDAESGMVTGLGPGAAVLRAELEFLSDSAAVIVEERR